jgi:dTDP-4-amino-4,6-dideoxygalactose transaminase
VALDNQHSENELKTSTLPYYAGYRDLIKSEMVNTSKVGVAVYYDPPVHLTPYYKELIRTRLPGQIREKVNKLKTTEWASKHVLSLPVHPLLSTQDIDYIANSFKSAKENTAK